ncbi:ComEA family DNA-binding protein [Amnibacterium kyonggiense]|uniref:Competence protein ComEA n=1 Tax=Amnibacterium kyonggiense TaxID=595671 RepID=A0A4R7FMR4_9MICO|nr:ComEA family DNA-binding protein [Amnibacterium kyonggiense]TDS77638.1 competence protein ComEA [Amnibacterium kyonggiense]
MDDLRTRFAALAAGRPVVLVLVGLLAVAVLGGAVLIGAGQASGSTAERDVVRVVPTTPAPTPLLVHVSGAVRSPGLVSLPVGARVVDAVAAAGGPTSAADESVVNLAARVADGQQVVVPKRGAAPAATAAAGTATGATVSLSSATAEQLETLPRIGPALAARIIAYREAHGGFSSVDELGQVGGIGPKTLAGLRDLVTP